jgi:hypothetical protein
MSGSVHSRMAWDKVRAEPNRSKKHEVGQLLEELTMRRMGASGWIGHVIGFELEGFRWIEGVFSAGRALSLPRRG